MRRSPRLSLVLACIALPAALHLGCSGSDGSDGAQGPAGPVGPAGSAAPGDPSISAVIPSSAFLGRTVDVVISGFGTAFDASTKAEFGADITVNKLTVASPTALIANISVAGTATVGPHDVKIGTLEYKGGFETRLPSTVTTQGKVAQGSIALLQAKQNDLTTLFDTTSTGDGFFTPLEYTNIKVSSFPGTTFQINGVTPFAIDMVALVDIDAEAGAKDLDILSGPAGSQTHNPIPGGFNIEARSAVELVSGTAADGNVENPFDSYLYKFTPEAGFKVIEFETKAAGSGASPGVVILPKSGKFADMIDFASSAFFKTDKSDPYYLVFWDNSGASGYDFSLLATSVSPAKGTEAAGDNSTFALAQTIASVPFLLEDAELTDEDDVDWFKFVAAAGDVGKKLRVRTFGDDASTDTVVEVFAADGTTSMGGESADADYHEDHTSTAITAAGDIYVKFSASKAGYFSASHTMFDALLTLK